MDEDNSVMPELKDIETKLGRKVPDSLIRSLVAGKHHEEHEKSAHLTNRKCCNSSTDLKRLESKMLFLKQEMVSLFVYSLYHPVCRHTYNKLYATQIEIACLSLLFLKFTNL